MPSSEEEIYEVYSEDIERKTKCVLGKRGIRPFLEGLSGYHTFNLYSEEFYTPEDDDA